MNRRSFLRSLIAAPIAAAVAPMAARQAYATGGVVSGPLPLVGEHVAGQWAYIGHVGPELRGVPYRPSSSEVRSLFAMNDAEITRHALMRSDTLSPLIDHDAFDRWSKWIDTPMATEPLSTAIPKGMTGC